MTAPNSAVGAEPGEPTIDVYLAHRRAPGSGFAQQIPDKAKAMVRAEPDGAPS